MAVRARRSVAGQHFLRSSKLAAEIVRASGVGPDDLVLDLGAGTGVLTAPLARVTRTVIAVELDHGLGERLRSRFPSVRVIEADVRSVELPREPFCVVANLPFDCGTEVLRRLLDPRVSLLSADVVVQWELALKRTSVWPATQAGVEWGAWHELVLARRLPRCCFAPRPAVDAAVLRSTRRTEPLVALENANEYRRFLRAGFQGGLRAVVPSRQLKRLADELGFARAARPRDLDASQWAAVFGSVRSIR